MSEYFSFSSSTLFIMNIETCLLTKNPFSRPGKPLQEVKGIVLHWTANPGTSAMQNRNYFESLKSQSFTGKELYASAHFIVGIEGEIIQCLPTDEMAYHVGAKLYTPEAVGRLGHYPNNCTIGIELCHPLADGVFTLITWQRAVSLIGSLCQKYKLNPLTDIWTHHQITQKICPKFFVDNPESFERFKLEVGIYMGENPEG